MIVFKMLQRTRQTMNYHVSLDRPSITYCLCGHKQGHHNTKTRDCVRCECKHFEIDDLPL